MNADGSIRRLIQSTPVSKDNYARLNTHHRLFSLKCVRIRMPDLPTGIVTFLFTDIEGSSKLWEQNPDLMPQVMSRHDALIE